MRFFNDLGGFTDDGSEYVIHIRSTGRAALELPPRPWTNVIANERFGFLASETGAGVTWSRNSREHRLTPWHNDPVVDPHGEALYIRDERTGGYWSPLPGPVPGGEDYEARHGFGYSAWRHGSHELEQETIVFAPRHDPLKITRIRIANKRDEARRVSVYSYARLVLGAHPGEGARLPATDRDEPSETVIARSCEADEYGGGLIFAGVVVAGGGVAAAGRASVHCSGDRCAFIGRNGSPARPLALREAGTLEGRTGAGLDPCIAHQVVLDVPPLGSVECSFLFGEADSLREVRTLVERYRAAGAIERALNEVKEFWTNEVCRIRVETPDRALDLLLNGWLPYQDLSCRIWARTALYQSGGAWGFRDQLQDASALVYSLPTLLRAQILLHAGHQFVEGDVLHWWHPPGGRGIRTRFADDLLWLPYVTAFYIEATGDSGILDERVPFLTARLLEDEEDEALVLPGEAGDPADLYEHCGRALDRSLTLGPHGLPLFGTGDWNDGMNRVGRGGKGESVWLGFFLYSVLGGFLPLCEERGDAARTTRYRAYREDLRIALDEAGWDGAWYRRGYYDDGAPLGSSRSEECRIDALAQAWAVISGAAPVDRAKQAMDSVETHLVDERNRLIRLLAPPFEKTREDPGYIKGYAPGVRENGGQYTHAALWVVRAMAELGRNDRAAHLLGMLNPITHADTPEKVAVYQVEPYVVAADVYGEPPHAGRGGWTWYTGSAGWMIRVTLESILGMHLSGGKTLVLKPCIPDEWEGFTIQYRLPGEATRYEIRVGNPSRSAGAPISGTIDGLPVPIEAGAVEIPLIHDGGAHHVVVVLGARDDAA